MPDKSLPPSNMSPFGLPPFSSPPAGFLAGDFLERLEQAWIVWRKDKTVPPPNLMEFLPAESVLRDRVLAPLAEVHFEYGLEDGQWEQVEAFLEKYPELRSHVVVLSALIRNEMKHRRDRGETVSGDEYWRRFPPFAALQVRDDFEMALREGKLPSIEDFLQNSLVPRPLALQHLAALDLSERLRRREHVRLEEYLARFPELPTAPEVLADFLLIEYQGRADFESDIPFAEYEKRFPTTYPVLARRLHIPRIEGFAILSQLGSGGMGKVYKAREDRLGGRLVAVKVILANALQRPDAMQRFQQEVNATAQVEHPNIARVYQVGEYQTEEGGTLPYLVMEYVPLGTLAAAMGGQPQNQRDAAETVKCLAFAVHAAHQRGIIHRDLKPQNVLLGPEPKITDFGLAKLLDQDSSMTQGQLVGTPAYMAPEQVKIQIHPIGPATDVWALGAILYEAITGRPPFLAPPEESPAVPLAESGVQRPKGQGKRSTTDILYRILHDEPIRPSRLERGTDPHLEAICLKCLEKSPKDRFASAEALAQELRRHLNHEKPTIRQVTLWSELRRWCRRRPAVAALTIGLATTLLLFAVISSVLALWAIQEKQTATVNATKERKARAQADALYERSENELYAAQFALAQQKWLSRDLSEVQRVLETCAAKQRGWEWHYMYQLCQVDRVTVDAPRGEVFYAVTFSPDDRHVVVGCSDKSIKVLDARTGKDIKALRGHEQAVTCLAFSDDGKLLVSGDAGGAIWMWDGKTFEGRRLGTHESGVIAVAYGGPLGGSSFGRKAISKDDRFVTVCDRGMMRSWNRAGGEVGSPEKLHDASEPTQSIAFDGTLSNAIMCLGGGADGAILLRIAGRAEKQRDVFALTCDKLDMSPNGKLFAIGEDPIGTVRLWHTRDVRHAMMLQGASQEGQYGSGVTGLKFSPDGERLAVTTRTALRVWDMRTAHLLVLHREVPSGALGRLDLPRCQIAFSHSGGKVVVCGGALTMVQIARGQSVDVPWKFVMDRGFEKGLAALDLSGRIALMLHGPDIVCLDLVTGNRKTYKSEEIHFNPSCSAVSPDGKWVVWGGRDGETSVGECKPLRAKLTLAKHVKHTFIRDVAFSPDSTCVASAGDDCVRIWDPATGKDVREPLRHDAHVFGVTFSPDGRLLATRILGQDRLQKIVLWDLASGKPIRNMEGDCVAFSANGVRMAIGHGRSIHIYDVAAGDPLSVLQGHTNVINCLAFSPDEKRIASGGNDCVIRIWDAERSQELLTLEAEVPVMHLQFTADNQRLISNGRYSPLTIWGGPPLHWNTTPEK